MRVFARRVSVVALLCVAGAAMGFGATAAQGASLEEVGEFEGPMFVTSYPNDAEKLLVVERKGKIELDHEGVVTTFADLTARVACPSEGCKGEQGLMSIALAPDFATSGRLFADYADGVSGAIHIDELTASGDTATWTRQILQIPHPEDINHNGGQLQFGPDGMLYASTGDGGGGNDVHHNSQNPATYLGKILRIDPAPSPSVTIWNMGLRNPFRFSFDRTSGAMVIADVGQGEREEVDYAPSPGPGLVGGKDWNYGWNCREGLIEGPADDLPENQCAERYAEGKFVDPVFDYPHSGAPAGAAQGCAIIGGYVVRDASVPDLYGRYVYGDLCEAEVRSLELTAADPRSTDRNEGLRNLGSIVSFGEDACRRVYVITGFFEVFRLVGAQAATCPPPSEGPGGGGQPGSSSSGGGSSTGGGHPTGDTNLPEVLVTTVRLRARRHVVPAGGRATLVATVSPCARRGRQRVRLLRGRHGIGTRRLDRRCRVVFHPTVRHRSRFRALVGALGHYGKARSNAVTVRVSGPR